MKRMLLLILLLMASTAYAEIYRWRDNRGVAHYTNREDEIPPRFRKRAVVLDLGLPSAPVAPHQPAASPTQPAGSAVQGVQLLTAPPSASTPPLLAPSRPEDPASLRNPPMRRQRDRATRGEE